MIDLTKKYKTRDGREVQLYYMHPQNSTNQDDAVHGSVRARDGSGRWSMTTWNCDGLAFPSQRTRCGVDLVEVPDLHRIMLSHLNETRDRHASVLEVADELISKGWKL